MVNRATATNDDLEQISQASKQVLEKVRQKQQRTTEQNVLFKRIEKQKEAATGRKQRADLMGETQRNILTGKSSTIDLLEYRVKKLSETEKQEKSLIDDPREDDETSSANTEIKDEKTELDLVLERISEKKTEDLGGDEKFQEKFQEKLGEKLTEIVTGGELKTDNEQIAEIREVIGETSESESVSAEVAAKEIVVELKKVRENYPEEVKEAERKNLAKEFEDKTKEKNKLTKEQEKSVRKMGELIADVVYGESVISNSDLSTDNSLQITGGKLKNAQAEVQVMIGLLNKKPEEVKKIRNEYRNFKELNKIDLPFNKMPKLAAFDRVLNSLEDQKIGQAFSLVHGGSWLKRIKTFGSSSIIESTGGFVRTIGAQASRNFVQNSIGILASGNFYAGFKNVLGGILNGGVKSVSNIGGLTKNFGVTGVSSPIGLVAVGGKALSGKMLGGLKDIGLDLLNKLKSGVGIGGKKTLGWLMGGLGAAGSIGGLITAMAVPLLIVSGVSVLGISLLTAGYSQLQSPTVLPTLDLTETNVVSDPTQNPGSEGVTGGSCAGGTLNISNIYEPINIDSIKKRVKASEYKYKSNGNIDFSCINGLLPQKGTRQRSDIIKAAYALLGVPYFMTGGHGTIADGVSPKWGNKITATCTYGNCGRKYLGLDCSGFVRWVYKYVTGEVVGNRARDIYLRSQRISKSELLPGDIGFISGDHIGIFFGKGTDGKYYFIHSAGRSSHVGPQGLGGVWISPYNFKQFGRIKVSLN